jgi:hypothetical protein
MASKRVDAALLTLALVLAACTRPPAGEEPAGAGTGTPVTSSETDAAAARPPEAEAARPAATVSAADLARAAPVPFGSTAEALQQAWSGSLLAVAEPEHAEACYYLLAQPSPRDGYGQAFMFEGGTLVRMDVDDSTIEAPGGARVGMQAAELEALYGGRLETRPHKYVENARYLRLAPQGGAAVLVLETDSQGRLQEWRVGVPPQVDYVEGCS